MAKQILVEDTPLAPSADRARRSTPCEQLSFESAVSRSASQRLRSGSAEGVAHFASCLSERPEDTPLAPWADRARRSTPCEPLSFESAVSRTASQRLRSGSAEGVAHFASCLSERPEAVARAASAAERPESIREEAPGAAPGATASEATPTLEFGGSADHSAAAASSCGGRAPRRQSRDGAGQGPQAPPASVRLSCRRCLRDAVQTAHAAATAACSRAEPELADASRRRPSEISAADGRRVLGLQLRDGNIVELVRLSTSFAALALGARCLVSLAVRSPVLVQIGWAAAFAVIMAVMYLGLRLQSKALLFVFSASMGACIVDAAWLVVDGMLRYEDADRPGVAASVALCASSCCGFAAVIYTAVLMKCMSYAQIVVEASPDTLRESEQVVAELQLQTLRDAGAG